MLTRIVGILAILILILSAGVYFSRGFSNLIPEPIQQIILWGLPLISIAFFIRYFNKMKEILRQKNTYYTLNLGLILSLLLGILIFSNYIAGIYKLRFDLTKQSLYSLSSQSINIINKIPEKNGAPIL